MKALQKTLYVCSVNTWVGIEQQGACMVLEVAQHQLVLTLVCVLFLASMHLYSYACTIENILFY